MYYDSNFQACNYENVEALLQYHNDYLSRQVTILLRKQFTRGCYDHGLRGLPTLLRVVLRLKVKRGDEDDAVCDAIKALLKQLDISWMDSDRSFTTEILRVISIFIYDFTELEAAAAAASTASEATDGRKSKTDDEKLHRDYATSEIRKGALTTLVKSKPYLKCIIKAKKIRVPGIPRFC